MKTDEEIILSVQNGNTDDFSIIIDRYRDKLKRYAKKFLFGYDEGEDLVQNVFIKSYRNIQGFNTKKKFSSWIYRIAHNEFINAIRDKKKETLPILNIDTFLPHNYEEKRLDMEEEELLRQIDDSLADLGPSYREPLVLFYFEGLSYREISDILRIPTSTVGIRIRRAKGLLKKDDNLKKLL